MGGSPNSGRKRSASPSQDLGQKQRPRLEGEAINTPVEVKDNTPVKIVDDTAWWEEWTQEEVTTFVKCYRKEMRAVKDAHPGVDRRELTLRRTIELKRLVKRDVIEHYRKLAERVDQEDLAWEQKCKEKKAKEEKAKEEKAKQEKAKQEKAKQEKAKQEKAKEEKEKEQKKKESEKESHQHTEAPSSTTSSKPLNSGILNKDTNETFSISGSPVTLTNEQQAILEKVKKGESVMFTGQAGTGKSILIEAIGQWCGKNRVQCAITAPTGLAAMNIKGQTIHKWAGLGLMMGSVKESIYRLKKSKNTNWTSTDLLIIDEASQVSAKMFDKMDAIARVMRAGTNADGPEDQTGDSDLEQIPFGGMQVVCVGDFFQIAPIDDFSKTRKKKKEKGNDEGPDYLFKSTAFQKLFKFNKYRLNISLRQQHGSEFANMLDFLRTYSGVTNEVTKLKKYFSQFVGTHETGKEVVHLCGTNDEVAKINNDNLSRLGGPGVCFIADDYKNTQEYPSSQIDDILKKRIRAEEILTLKPGAQIIYLKNDNLSGLVNGHLGLVAFLLTNDLHHKYRQDYKELYPLYKRCRETNIRIDTLGSEPPKEIKGVASDRVLQSWNYYKEALIAIESSYISQAEAQRKHHKPAKMPPDPSFNTELEIVIRVGENQGPQSEKFHLVGLSEFDERDYSKHRYEPDSMSGERIYPMICSRTQVPLALSWALTIHKAQGQTLRRTMVNMNRLDGGQAYVALSRVRASDDLRLVTFSLPTFQKLTHHSVHKFDETLKGILE